MRSVNGGIGVRVFVCCAVTALVSASGPALAQAERAPAAASGTTVNGDTGAWSLRLPANWREGPAVMLEATNAEVARREVERTGPRVVYTHVFVREDTADEGDAQEPVYILIQETLAPMNALTLDQLEREHSPQRMLGNLESVKAKDGGAGATPSDVESTFDRAQARFRLLTMLSSSDVPYRSYSQGAYYDKGAVQVNFYTPASRFAALRAEADGIFASLAIAPQHAFVPAQASAPISAAPTARRRWLVPASAAAGSLLIVIAFLAVRNSRRSASS